MERLKDVGIKVLRTDEQGAIEVRLEGDKVLVMGYGGGKRGNMPRKEGRCGAGRPSVIKEIKKEKRFAMDIKCDDMRRRKEQISKELEKIYCLEKQFPKGELLCTKNNNRYKWLVKGEEGTSYLPKSKRKLAEILAIKKYYNCKKQELEKNLSACDAYLQKMSPMEGKTEQLLYHPEYGKLLEKHFIPVNEELWKWQSAPYERCQKHEESFIIKGTQGKMLRSKSEAMIDMMLYKNKIPFRYEEKLVLDGITLYPDFVIRHPVTGEYYYWEHFGMMDEEDYRNYACNKIKLYCQNGIIPSVNLIMTYETQKHPLSVAKVELMIQEYFGV